MAASNKALRKLQNFLTEEIILLFDNYKDYNSLNKYDSTDNTEKKSVINNYIEYLKNIQGNKKYKTIFDTHYADSDNIDSLKAIMLDDLVKHEEKQILNREEEINREEIWRKRRQEEAFANEVRERLRNSDLWWKLRQEEAHVKVLKDNLENSDINMQIANITRYLSKTRINNGGYKKTSNSKINSKKVSNKPVVSQKKHSIYKEILGKKMKIYKMPDSQKEYVKYKGELHHISDYKDLMKQKAKPKAKSNK